MYIIGRKCSAQYNIPSRTANLLFLLDVFHSWFFNSISMHKQLCRRLLSPWCACNILFGDNCDFKIDHWQCSSKLSTLPPRIGGKCWSSQVCSKHCCLPCIYHVTSMDAPIASGLCLAVTFCICCLSSTIVFSVWIIIIFCIACIHVSQSTAAVWCQHWELAFPTQLSGLLGLRYVNSVHSFNWQSVHCAAPIRLDCWFKNTLHRVSLQKSPNLG